MEVAAFRREGTGGLAARPATGRPPKPTATQEKVVPRWLAGNPPDFGFATELWTAPRLQRLIGQEFGVRFHANCLTPWLRERGHTPQLPRRPHRERDDGAIARWLAEDWPRINRRARRLGACLMLFDESGLLMAPLRRRSWSWRGRPAEIKEKAGHREKVSAAGAPWLTPLRRRLHFAYQTLANGYFSNEEVADFLRAGLRWRGEPVVVTWDGGSMHKGGPINALVARSGGRLILGPRPAHAPKLNPVEQVWTWLKYGRLCNFAPRDGHDLDEAVVRELDAVREAQVRLRNFFHASDLPLPRALLSLDAINDNNRPIYLR